MAAPLVKPAYRLSGIAVKNQRLLGNRPGQHLERNLGDYPQRTKAAGDQARNVVARHVLHNLAAKVQHLTGAIDQLHPQHEVTHRSRLLAAWAGQTRGNAAAHRSTTEMWRFKSQHLTFFRQHCLDFCKRRAALGGDVELSRFVGNNAAITGNIEDFPGQHAAVEILAAGTADTQRRSIIVCCLDGGNNVVKLHQKRSSSGNLTSP